MNIERSIGEWGYPRPPAQVRVYVTVMSHYTPIEITGHMRIASAPSPQRCIVLTIP